MSVVYHCLACNYVAEESEMPAKCGRCLDGEVEPLTPDCVTGGLVCHLWGSGGDATPC